LEQRLFPELASSYSEIRGEVPYGKELKSRVDFLLTSALLESTEDFDRPIYLEVKSVTLAQGNVALFPDTVTTRGQKHLRELMALLPQARAVMLYFINRGDCTHFAPCDRADPVYGQLLREAVERGVEVLPCRFEITPQEIRYLGLAEFLPRQPSVVSSTEELFAYVDNKTQT
jgi:sugar fermentation stimulation protein A